MLPHLCAHSSSAPSGPGSANRAPVVCLHGSLWTGAVFSPLLSYWRPPGGVWVYDLPGHGQSPLPDDQTLTLERTGDLIAAAMDRDGLRGATVVGHSWGGMIGVYVAHVRPDLVSTLVAMGITLDAEDPAMIPAFRALNAQVKQSGSACLVDMLMGMFFAPRTLVDPEFTLRCRHWRAELGGFPPAIAAVITGIIDRPDLHARARALTQPVFLIDGADDQRFPAAVRASSLAAFRHVIAKEIQGLGHMALLEDPSALARVFTEYGIGQ